MRYINVFEGFKNEQDNQIKKYFQPKVNLNIIQYIKDLSMEYIDDGFILSYFVSIGSYIPPALDRTALLPDNLLTGYFTNSRIWDNWVENFSNSFTQNSMKFEKEGIQYNFKIYKLIRGNSRGNSRNNREANYEVLLRIREEFPNEMINTYGEIKGI